VLVGGGERDLVADRRRGLRIESEQEGEEVALLLRGRDEYRGRQELGEADAAVVYEAESLLLGRRPDVGGVAALEVRSNHVETDLLVHVAELRDLEVLGLSLGVPIEEVAGRASWQRVAGRALEHVGVERRVRGAEDGCSVVRVAGHGLSATGLARHRDRARQRIIEVAER